METFSESPLLPSLPNDFADTSSTLSGSDNIFASQSEESWPEDEMLGDIARNNARSPQKRLENLIQYNEDQAVAIMRAWLREGKIA
jgi:flagellar M-ring protein FliF